MKTIVKLITVNDGKCEDYHNGDFLSVIDYPRTEAIISAFLDDGYVLESRTQRITPSVQEEGAYSFYIGGGICCLPRQLKMMPRMIVMNS